MPSEGLDHELTSTSRGAWLVVGSVTLLWAGSGLPACTGLAGVEDSPAILALEGQNGSNSVSRMCWKGRFTQIRLSDMQTASLNELGTGVGNGQCAVAQGPSLLDP